MIDKKDTEETGCPLCGSNEREPSYADFSKPFSVVRCRACNFHYLSPRLTEEAMMRVYEQDNYFESDKGGYTSYSEQEDALRATFRRFVFNLNKNGLAGGAFLEVGCGYGYLLTEAAGVFDFRAGTDFSSQACIESRKNADIIYEGGIEKIPVDKKFNCISAVNVIEHVYDPKAFIAGLSRHLGHGGKIVIATPDMGSFWRVLMGHRWPSFKIPEHILYFNEKTLFDLMQGSGLHNIRAIPFPHAFPLSLVASKFNIKFPSIFSRIKLWVPKTMIAMYGESDNG